MSELQFKAFMDFQIHVIQEHLKQFEQLSEVEKNKIVLKWIAKKAKKFKRKYNKTH